MIFCIDCLVDGQHLIINIIFQRHEHNVTIYISQFSRHIFLYFGFIWMAVA